jgi:hypothetical protein
MVALGDPKHRRPYPSLGAIVQVVGLEVVGDRVMLTFACDEGKFRGAVSNMQQPPLGKGEVVGVNKEADNVLVNLVVSGKTVRLLNVHNLADED